ncbi:hypothetical protein SAY87_005042 [Trapa incisa]|uniref:J domain-containing protein n=2 Tax=Trapa TaxID=22665 RepID=A0AAN7LJQ1_TRANT|nr:hypothetical protein SAY87_005042 [Trapa incisa]KAK4782016.1 hypothetical protein SAY86_016118 [Trapa natans]
MLRAIAPPLPPTPLTASPAGVSSSSSVRKIATKRMHITCKATCHAPPFAEVRPPSAYAVGRRPDSLYEVLRVKQTATPTEIKAAYRMLAKVYHPDSASQTKSDGRDFIEIHNAYATLSDPAARAVYDLSLGRKIHRRSVSGNGIGFHPNRRWETDQCW